MLIEIAWTRRPKSNQYEATHNGYALVVTEYEDCFGPYYRWSATRREDHPQGAKVWADMAISLERAKGMAGMMAHVDA